MKTTAFKGTLPRVFRAARKAVRHIVHMSLMPLGKHVRPQDENESGDENGVMMPYEAGENHVLRGAEEACPPVSDCPMPEFSHRAEGLLACTMLMQASLCTADEFIALVDAMFLENGESALLQELEWSFHDIPRGIHLIDEYFTQTPADNAALGEILFSRLRAVYLSGNLAIDEFARRAYRLWSLLPETLAYEEPFYVLSYADEVLGGWCQKDPEKEARALYEKALGLRADGVIGASDESGQGDIR